MPVCFEWKPGSVYQYKWARFFADEATIWLRTSGDENDMKWITTLLLVTTLFFLPEDVVAADASVKLRALRLERQAAIAARPSDIGARANTNFDGVWADRYFFCGITARAEMGLQLLTSDTSWLLGVAAGC